MKKTALFLLSLLILAGCQKGPSNLRLPSIISDNMLIQQKTDTRIWGNANPGARIFVAPSWGTEKGVRAGKDGKWTVDIPAPVAGGPYKIRISASDTTINISNILCGEVWVCSGQSNMEMPVQGWPPRDTIMGSAQAIREAALPEIRLFMVARKVSSVPLEDCTGQWMVCSPETVRQFSATGFFFGRAVYSKIKTPVGLIGTYWGGTPSEAWTSDDALVAGGEFIDQMKAMKESEPLVAQYQAYLDKHQKVDVKPAGDDQYKNLGLGDEAAANADFNDSAWPVMKQPVKFESVLGEFDGVVWYRRVVNVPAALAGKDLVLSLGPIDDMDCAWFNGKLVGATETGGFWQTERHYDVPGALVKAGPNVIAVRVLDTGGGGGMWGSADQMTLAPKRGKQAPIDLSGDWKYQVSAELYGNKFYVFDMSKNDYQSVKKPVAIGPYSPATLYNGMINPIINYRIKGAIWYQGEANVGRAAQYEKIFPMMIMNWRNKWQIPDFPFYFVQIAPYTYQGPDSTDGLMLREAQAASLKTPKTGMVVTLDITTVNNIHPPFKIPVGERLAALALNNDYGISTPCQGPVYASMKADGRILKVLFSNTGMGLKSNSELIHEFELAGKDGKFYKATAKIEGSEVWLTSPNVEEPVKVTYCWRNCAEGTLLNSFGLPAAEFSAAL